MISYNPRDLDVIDLFPDDDLRASGGQPTLFERLLTSAADRAHLAREMPGYVPREGHRLKGTPWPLLLILATLPPGSEERQRAVKEAVAGVFERFSRPLPDRGSSAASLTSSSNELDMFRGDDAAGGAEALGLQEEAQYLLKALGGRSRRVTEKGAAAFVSKLLCRQLGVKLEADFGGGVVATRFRKIVAGDVGFLMNGGEFVDAKRLADYLAAIAKVWATSDDEKRHPARVLRPLWKALGGAGPDRQRKRRPRPAARPEPPPPPPPEARDPPPPAPSAPAYRMYADAAAPFCINPETVVVGSPVAFCRRAHLPEVALSPRAFEHHHNQQPSPANRRFDTDPSVRYQLPPDNPLYVPPPGAPVVATHRIVTCKVNEIGVVHLHPPKPPAGKSRCPLGVVAEPEPKAPSANIEMVMAERAGIRPKSGAAAAFDWDRWEKKKNFAGSTVTSMRLLRRREAARLRRERRAAKRSLHERYHGLMQSASADWRDLYDFVENATQHQAISDSLAAVGPFVGDPVV